jgi:hypothetical protein
VQVRRGSLMIQEDFIEADEMGKCVEACEEVIGL